MDLITQLAPFRFELTGTGELHLGNGTSVLSTFRLAQRTDGHILLELHPEKLATSDWILSDLDSNAFMFIGSSANESGSRLISSGLVPMSSLGNIGGSNTITAMIYRSSEVVVAQSDEAIEHEKHPHIASGHTEAHYYLSNYYGHYVSLSYGSAAVEVVPNRNLKDVVALHSDVGGFIETASMKVTGVASIEESDRLAQALCLSMTLATGHYVWYYGRSIFPAEYDQGITHLWNPHLRYTTKNPPSIRNLFPYSLVFDHLAQRDESEIRLWTVIVQRYAEACDEQSFLETRTASASSLLEFLVNHAIERWSVDQHPSYADPKIRSVKAKLKARLREIERELALNEDQASLFSNGIGVIGSVGFPARLSAVMRHAHILDDRIQDEHVSSAVHVRNIISHGSLLEGDEYVKYDQYHLVIWTCAAIIARLLGIAKPLFKPPPPLSEIEKQA